MTNNRFLFSTIGLAIANAMLVGVGVILMPTILLAWVWALGCLVLHLVLLMVVAYYDLQATLAADALDFQRKIANRMVTQ